MASVYCNDVGTLHYNVATLRGRLYTVILGGLYTAMSPPTIKGATVQCNVVNTIHYNVPIGRDVTLCTLTAYITLCTLNPYRPQNYDVQSAKQNYLPPLHTLGFDGIANRLRTLDPFTSLQYIVYTACRQSIVYIGYLHYIVYTESL